MTFNIWDNIFAGYMSDPDGGVALFDRKVDADRAIQHFVRTLSRRNDWLLRLDVQHLEANLCYHLQSDIRPDGSSLFHPCLLPMNFNVPPSHWKLLAEDGSEMRIGMTVALPDGTQFALAGMQPPHKMSASGRVYVSDANGTQRRYYADLIRGTFRYRPPETALTAHALRWAEMDTWEQVRPFDVPPPRKLVLPPRPNWNSLIGRGLL